MTGFQNPVQTLPSFPVMLLGKHLGEINENRSRLQQDIMSVQWLPQDWGHRVKSPSNSQIELQRTRNRITKQQAQKYADTCFTQITVVAKYLFTLFSLGYAKVLQAIQVHSF